MTVIIKDAYAAGVTAVTINGLQANQNPTKANEWRKTLDGDVKLADVKVVVTREGTVPDIDKTELNTAISTAQAKVDAAVSGSAPGNYPQSAIESLNAAIASARAVADSPVATQNEVSVAVTSLETAIQGFEAAKIPAQTDNVIYKADASIGLFGEIHFTLILQPGVTATSVWVDDQKMTLDEPFEGKCKFKLSIESHSYKTGDEVTFRVETAGSSVETTKPIKKL